nr:TPA_inf: conotoxin precursor Con-ikot-ikot [Conus ebraeus]
MAMNVWMTISVLVVVVMATAVTGSTPSQEQERSSVDRTKKSCCAMKTYECLRDRDCLISQDSDCATPCKNIDTSGCDSADGNDCCASYMDCVVDCQIDTGSDVEDPLAVCYNSCNSAHSC